MQEPSSSAAAGVSPQDFGPYGRGLFSVSKWLALVGGVVFVVLVFAVVLMLFVVDRGAQAFLGARAWRRGNFANGRRFRVGHVLCVLPSQRR